ncbi:hypothetical protein [Streptomyces bacillaris]|uniref:hypothetical protein n=1 Tax=Streptomyces bacillaris TaxID=68179 RepID=UPI000DD73A67
MSEWLLVGFCSVVLAVVLPWASRLLPRRRPPAPAPGPAARDTERRMWARCDRPRCGHMEWPHDVTSAGLRCTHCGHINTSAS